MLRRLTLLLLCTLAACSPAPEAPLPTLASLEDIVADAAEPATTAGDPASPRSTQEPLREVVGVPTPTPPYLNFGSFISRLRPNERVRGSMTEAVSDHIYTFDGQSGMLVNVELMRLTGTIEPLVTLYTPAGERIAMDAFSGPARTARLRNVRLPVDGLYSIHASGAGRAGDYQIILQDMPQIIAPDQTAAPPAQSFPTPYATPTLGPALPDARLQDHQPLLSNIPRPGDFQRFTFETAASETISIGVMPSATSSLRPMFEVFGPEGVLIANVRTSSSNAGGGAFAAGIPIPEAGVYTIIVTSEDSSTGGFRIGYGRGTTYEDVYKGQPSSDIRIGGQLQQRGQRDIYRVTLNQGDIITVVASPDQVNLDPVVEIADENGQLLYSDSNSGGDRAAVIRLAQIERSGVYQLRVRDAAATGVGTYTLVWRYVNLAPTSTPPPDSALIMALRGEVDEDTYAFYVFYGEAGQRVQIRVRAQPGSLFDPVAALIAPDGSVLAEGDDSAGTLNPDFFAVLPEDGSYTVRVNGYLSAGSFDVLVALLF